MSFLKKNTTHSIGLISTFLFFGIFFSSVFLLSIFISPQISLAETCTLPNECKTPMTSGERGCPGGATSFGSCSDAPTQLCCGPSTLGPSSSCPGGACLTACTGSFAVNSGTSCSATDGGGTCCKPTPIPPPGTISIPFDNALAFDTVEGVLGKLLSTLQGIIVVLSLVFIVIGAVLYITSAGDEGRMGTAKGAITASMIGLALGIAAPSFLKEISSILDWNATDVALTNAKSLTEIALSTLQFLLSVVGILGIIMLVIGGLTYITASGDEGRAETGKKIVTYAIIGIAVALAALIIVTQIAALFV